MKTKYRIKLLTNDNKALYNFGIKQKPKSLKDFCEHMEKSELPGGCNAHLAEDRGFLLSISGAKLVRQSDGVVVDEYSAPMFRVL